MTSERVDGKVCELSHKYLRSTECGDRHAILRVH